MSLIFTSTGVNASQDLRGLSGNNQESGNQSYDNKSQLHVELEKSGLIRWPKLGALRRSEVNYYKLYAPFKCTCTFNTCHVFHLGVDTGMKR